MRLWLFGLVRCDCLVVWFFVRMCCEVVAVAWLWVFGSVLVCVFEVVIVVGFVTVCPRYFNTIVVIP